MTCIIIAMLTSGLIVSHHDMITLLIDQNVEALSEDGEEPEPWWAGKKLKVVDCKCSNGKAGMTFQCRDDGDLEDCTSGQQGSAVCYKKPTITNPSLSILCSSGWSVVN